MPKRERGWTLTDDCLSYCSGIVIGKVAAEWVRETINIFYLTDQDLDDLLHLLLFRPKLSDPAPLPSPPYDKRPARRGVHWNVFQRSDGRKDIECCDDDDTERFSANDDAATTWVMDQAMLYDNEECRQAVKEIVFSW